MRKAAAKPRPQRTPAARQKKAAKAKGSKLKSAKGTAEHPANAKSAGTAAAIKARCATDIDQHRVPATFVPST